MVKVVEQGLHAEGRVDVRQLVMGAVDTAVGSEVGGVVLPRPKLRAAAQECNRHRGGQGGRGGNKGNGDSNSKAG